jgi:4'-phosphopantetheinyl transferase EntD
MHTWKIVQTIENLNNSEWDELVTKSLGKNFHPDRKSSFILSRKALQNCLKEHGINADIHQLSIENHSKLIHFSRFCLSLAHTKSCGAALIADSKIFKSVGIDIELTERKVSEAVKERISHPEDANLKNIELWCLKEAAFKAIMNTTFFKVPIEFSSIKIASKHWSHSPSGLKGEWELHDLGNFTLALAFLKN